MDKLEKSAIEFLDPVTKLIQQRRFDKSRMLNYLLRPIGEGAFRSGHFAAFFELMPR